MCGGNREQLRGALEEFFADTMIPLPEDLGRSEPQQTVGVERVLQRAAIHAISSEMKKIDGTNVLIQLFKEQDSHAVFLLQESGLRSFDLKRYASHGVGQDGMDGMGDDDLGPDGGQGAFEDGAPGAEEDGEEGGPKAGSSSHAGPARSSTAEGRVSLVTNCTRRRSTASRSDSSQTAQAEVSGTGLIIKVTWVITASVPSEPVSSLQKS